MHKCIRIKRKQSEGFMTPETSNGNKLAKQILYYGNIVLRKKMN